MIDYHIHTPLCRHARGTLEQYRTVAQQQDLTEIGIADHFPLEMLGCTPEAQVSMNPDELDGYVRSVQDLAAGTQVPVVKLGIEVDYLSGSEQLLAGLLEQHPFDYIIGSVHFIDGWDFTHPYFSQEFETRDLSRIYNRYFELVWAACESGLFDIIGHIDVVKKFGYRPVLDLASCWRDTAAVLKKTNTCLELNTAGLDAPAGECYPGRELLECCFESGVAVTLGSDAHAPEQVGRYFKQALTLLQEIGYRELAIFTKRKRGFLPLEG